MNKTDRRKLCLYILLPYFCFSLAYSVVVPLWEAPDEPAHYLRLRKQSGLPRIENLHFFRSSMLPGDSPRSEQAKDIDSRELLDAEEFVYRKAQSVFDPSYSQDWLPTTVIGEYEYTQPPLYYRLVSTVAAFFPHEPLFLFDALYNTHGRNMFLHNLDHESENLKGTLSVHLLRLCSVLFGLMTVLLGAVYLMRVFPGGAEPATALMGGIALALQPQLLFVSATLNNDSLAVTLSCLAVLLFGFRAVGKAGRRPILDILGGLVLAAALATKLTALAVVPAIPLAAFFEWRRSRRFSSFLRVAFWGLLPLLIGVIVFALFRSGEFSEASRQLYARIFHLRADLLNTEYLFGLALPRMFLSFWGTFGWMQLFPGRLLGIIFGLTSLAAFAGVFLRLFRLPEARTGALYSLTLAIPSLLAAGLNGLAVRQPQGRYLLVAVLPLFAWGASGLAALFPARYRNRLPIVALLLLIFLNTYFLLGVIRPAYYPLTSPNLLRADQAASLFLRYGHGFYVEEADGSRWMAARGILTLHNRSDAPVRFRLKLRARGFLEGPLELWQSGHQEGSWKMSTSESLKIETGILEAKPGISECVLFASAGARVADDLLKNGDPRKLAVLFEDFQLIKSKESIPLPHVLH